MAEQRANPGRARGRSRGRGQPLLPDAPGSVPQPGVGRRGGSDAEVAMLGSGRGMQRGSHHPSQGPRGDAAAACVSAAVRGVSRMTISGNRQVMLLGARRALDPALFDTGTKPDHIDDKRGMDGTPVRITTNYFPLVSSKAWHLYQYRVDYEPDVDHKGARRGMLKDHLDLIGSTYMFDGSTLYTLKRLPEKDNIVHSKRLSDNATIQLKIALVAELPPNSPLSVQLFNLIFRRHGKGSDERFSRLVMKLSVLKKLGMEQVGRHYYDSKAKFTVNCDNMKFELWPGIITSIMQYERGNVMMCTEISHKMMRVESVLTIMKQMFDQCRQRRANFHQECEHFLFGQIVLTRYNHKTYRVDGIEWNMKVGMTFRKGDQDISYVDYYKTQYNVTINDMNQPLLVSRPKRRDVRGGVEVIHLVPELCTVTGLSDEHRANFSVMKALAEHTKQGPAKRINALKNFIQRVCSHTEATDLLKKWGLHFEKELVGAPARILPPEQLLFGDNKRITGGQYASWDNDLRNLKLLRCVELRSWNLICRRQDQQTANNLIQKMCQVARNLGFNMSRPIMNCVEQDRTDVILSTIKDICANSKNCQLILCLLSGDRRERYDSIKKACCIDVPVPTQVVKTKTLSKPQRVMSIATKIAIQINCKLGGEAWAVNIPIPGAMIIGIDTYHDSLHRSSSVGGFVASINRGFTRWFSSTTTQQAGVELIDGLKVCMVGALKKYKSVNEGAMPKKVFVFRDGVGDGQLGMVREHEVPQIIQCLTDPTTGKSIPLSYIVVKKRINTRLFMSGRQGMNNPPPGTIVDDVITRPESYDFFVVSQNVREGTVSPTHYNVIFDESGLKPNYIQRLAYKLCHIYYNWPGTVRVPAPCMYAHKLAFLVGQSVHRNPDASLADKLYFL